MVLSQIFCGKNVAYILCKFVGTVSKFYIYVTCVLGRMYVFLELYSKVVYRLKNSGGIGKW